MALKLSVQHDSGAVADYWRVEGLAINIAGLAAEVTLALYLNEEARRTNKRPIYRLPIELPAVELIKESKKDPVAKAYDLIKAIPKWASAQDV